MKSVVFLTVLTVFAVIGKYSAVATQASQGPPIIAEPALCIGVEYVAGSVRFTFYERSLYRDDLVQTAARYVGLKRADQAPSIWTIVSLDGMGAREVTYGVIPVNFRQLVPASGSPPPLQTGRRYYVSAKAKSTGVEEFVFEGPQPGLPCM